MDFPIEKKGITGFHLKLISGVPKSIVSDS